MIYNTSPYLKAIDFIFWIASIAIIVRALISWFPVSKDNQIVKLLYQLTEPILAPIRRLVENSSIGRSIMFDISPIVALILLEVVKNIIKMILKPFLF